MAETLWGHSPAGLYGYSHLLGGYAGGQAEYLRVPFADVGPIKVPDHLSDEQVLFLSDIFPTGYMAADLCDIQPGDTIAIWGCGPVGQFAIRSALLLGAGRVIAIDTVPERLALARAGGAETLDFMQDSIYDRLQEMTSGRGPDACIDAVGTEASPRGSIDAVLDRAKQAAMLGTDRPHVLRQAITNCRNGGTVSIVGVYGGLLDKVPMGSAINRGLTFKMAQTPVQKYLRPLMDRIERGEIDPSFVITHSAKLEDGPDLYRVFRDKEDACIKVVLKPESQVGPRPVARARAGVRRTGGRDRDHGADVSGYGGASLAPRGRRRAGPRRIGRRARIPQPPARSHAVDGHGGARGDRARRRYRERADPSAQPLACHCPPHPGAADLAASGRDQLFADPGSAMFRCSSASTADGVTDAMAVCSLFFQPLTTSPSPRIIASNPVFATSAASSFLAVPTLVSIMSARSKKSVSVAPGIRQVTVTPVSFSSCRSAKEKLSRNAFVPL